MYWQQSTECPSGEECFAQTPCTEEMGYPEDGGINGTMTEDDGDCVPFVVTITSDQWPKEISWQVEDTDVGEVVIEGTSDTLIPGEPVKYEQCVNKRGGCYAFTINGENLCDCIVTVSINIDLMELSRIANDSLQMPEGTVFVANMEREAMKYHGMAMF